MADMETILEDLNRNPAIEGALVVGAQDGLVIAAAGDTEPDPDFLAAESMEMYLNAATGLEEKYNRGQLELLTLEGERGRMFIKTITPEFFLLVLANKDTNLGLIRLDIDQAGEALKEEL